MGRLTLAAVGVGAALLLGAYAKGYQHRGAFDRSAALSAQVRGLEQMTAAAAEIQKQDAAEAARARADAAENRGKANELLLQLAAAPSVAACAWTDDERRRVLSIRVHPPAAGERPAGRTR